MNFFNNFRPATYHWILFIATIVFGITAWNSHGHFCADEHFQIIEFARLKMGINKPVDMPWEFKEQIRSTIQPVICFFLFKCFNFVNITDLFVIGFLLRLLTAAFAIYSIHRFIICTEHLIQNKNARIAYYVLSYFIWFIPFISVRFSSETWGGLFFLNALTVHFNSKQQASKSLLIGCMLGLSFLFRFQTAFASLGFVLWLIVVDKMNMKELGKLIVGSLISLLIGFLIDRWFYGNFVFTPWNYFYANLVKDIASVFGVSPWYEYFRLLWILPGHFLGVLIMLSFLLLLFTKPKNIAVWCILPFFIVHSLIPHKEERFLFPMVYLLPILLISAYEKLAELIQGKVLIILNFLFIAFFITLNSAGLLIMAGRSAGIGRMGLVKYIHDHYHDKPINFIYCTYADIRDKHGGIVPYEEKKMHLKEINNLCDLSDSLIVPGEENILVIRKENLELESCNTTISENHFVLQEQSVSELGQWFNEYIYGAFSDEDIYQLYTQEK